MSLIVLLYDLHPVRIRFACQPITSLSMEQTDADGPFRLAMQRARTLKWACGFGLHSFVTAHRNLNSTQFQLGVTK